MKMLRNIRACAICSLFLAIVIVAEVSDNAANQVQQTLDSVTPISNASKLAKEIEEKYGTLRTDPNDLPAMNEGEVMLLKLCERNGGADSYQNAKMAVKNIKNCFNDVVVFSMLPRQIQEARTNGNLDQVFRKYCLRLGDFRGCVHQFLLDIDPCLDIEQKTSKYTIQNVTEQILNFACENEGDYMALFISEKGPQCIASRQQGIEECINKGLNKSKSFEMYEKLERSRERNSTELIQEDGQLEKEFSLNFTLAQCRTAYRIRTCIIEELKNCSGSTPANVVETIFNIVQRSSKCANYTRAEIDPTYSAAASSMFTSFFSIVIPAVTILLARTFSS